MIKKLVSFLFIANLIATMVFITTLGNMSLYNIEYNSNNSGLEINLNSASVDGHLSSIPSKVSAVTAQRTIQYDNYNTTFTTDKTEYKPGDQVNVQATTDVRGFNGSMDWTIKNPINELVFSPTKSATDIFFDDPSFSNDSTLIDWNNNDGFILNAENNYINITSTTVTQKQLVYNKYSDIKGNFLVEFNYKTNSTADNGNMTLTYWNGSSYNNFFLNITNNNIVTFEKSMFIDTTNASINSLFFTLSSVSNWIIYPFTISYDEKVIDFSDGNSKSGTLQNVWIHGKTNSQRDVISVNYFIHSSISIEKSVVTFNFTLPSTQVYMGEWQLKIQVNPVSESNFPLTTTHEFYLPILVNYQLYFETSRQYIYRGQNITDSTSIYKDETNSTSVYSPSDKLVFVGKLFTNISTLDELDSFYFKDLTGMLQSNTTINGINQFNWNETGIAGYSMNNSILSESIYKVLPENLKNNYTWLIEFTVPERGIYGKVDQNLQLFFDSFIPVNASNGVVYSNPFNTTINLNPINVKFGVNVSSSNIPFDRTWFLTEFMEGNFSVNTWRFDVQNLQATNNAVNQSYEFLLNIPKSDLIFDVYLQNNNTNAIEEYFLISLLPNNQSFYYTNSISSNLDTNVIYKLGLTFKNPTFSEEASQEVSLVESKDVYYNIKGTLTVELPLERLDFQQGDNLKIKFNITIDQLNGKAASGLKLNAIIKNKADFNPQIIEKNGEYELILSLPDNAETGEFTIDLIKTSTQNIIGSININILPHSVESQDVVTVVPIVYSLIGSILAIVILAGFIIQLIRIRK
jgi:hypothetical protein